MTFDALLPASMLASCSLAYKMVVRATRGWISRLRHQNAQLHDIVVHLAGHGAFAASNSDRSAFSFCSARVRSFLARCLILPISF